MSTEQLANRRERSHDEDPTKTTTIQKQYARKLRGRFAKINAEIRKAVGERDIFDLGNSSNTEQLAGLPTPLQKRREYAYEALAECDYDEFHRRVGEIRSSVEQLADFDPDDLEPTDFQFERNAEKHEHFMRWLRRQEEKGVLSVIDRNDNQYVQRSYEKGIEKVHSDLRDSDVDVSVEDVRSLINQPIHRDRLSILFERNYEALQGITDEMAREMGRILSDGMLQGSNPREVARELSSRVSSIGKTRSTVLARTEILNAHNDSFLNRVGQLGFEEVEVFAETITAQDDRVCDICSPRHGNRMTLEEARSDGPPWHPQCRCTYTTRYENN